METLKIKFSYPYGEASERCKKQALSRDDYDHTSLFRWGNMLAMSVIGMLKAAEREFGKEGQRAMISALVEVGRDVGRQILDGVEIPDDAEPIEVISAYASWINREIYASPEEPRIDDEDHCGFDILWCPHQDSYQPFDCRVQRYLVQGMIEAFRERLSHYNLDFQVEFTKTIPAGGDVCSFELRKKKPGEKNTWDNYSDSLAKKALEKAGK